MISRGFFALIFLCLALSVSAQEPSGPFTRVRLYELEKADSTGAMIFASDELRQAYWSDAVRKMGDSLWVQLYMRLDSVRQDSAGSTRFLVLDSGNVIRWRMDRDSQSLSLVGTDLSISNGNTVDLSALQDGVGSDDQQVSIDSTGRVFTIALEDGGSVTFEDQVGSGNDSTDLVFTNLPQEVVFGCGDDNVRHTFTVLVYDPNDATVTGTISVQFDGLTETAISTDATQEHLLYAEYEISVDNPDDQDKFATITYTDDDGDITTFQKRIQIRQDGCPDLSLSGTSLELTNDPTPVDLSLFLDNTDNQSLTLSGDTLSISGGNSVILDGLGGGSDDQTLSLSGTTLSIESGNSVDLAVIQDGTGSDDQQVSNFSITNDVLSLEIENDGQPAQTVDLSPYLDDQLISISGVDLAAVSGTYPNFTITVSAALGDLSDVSAAAPSIGQVLEWDGANWVPASDDTGSGGGMSSFSLAADSGSSEAIEQGDVVAILGGSGISTTVAPTDQVTIDWSAAINDLSDVSAGAPSIDDVLQWNGSAWITTPQVIDTDTDDQTLSLAGTILSIVDGNSVNLAGIDTDNQTLSLVSNSLSITGGNSVDLSPYLDNTDGQTLSFDGASLSISGGNSVDISGVDTDTDDQTLSLVGTTLSIADGNSVDLSVVQDGTGSDDQTVTNFSISGSTLTLEIESDGQLPHQVDLSPFLDNTDGQTLFLSGTTLSITGGNSVDLSSIDTDTDDQTLSLSGTTLSIAGGNSVDLSGIDTDTDDQTLSLSGTTLSIADGNSVDLAGIDTDDQLLSWTQSTQVLGISGGNSVDLTEGIQDAIGTMVSGNTETGIAVTYDDANGKFDFVASDDSPTNELQTLGLSGTILDISDGNSVDLAGIDTDDQQIERFELSPDGDTLYLAIQDDGQPDQFVLFGQAADTSRVVEQKGHGFKRADMPIPVYLDEDAVGGPVWKPALSDERDHLHEAFVVDSVDADHVKLQTEGIFIPHQLPHAYVDSIGKHYFLTRTAYQYTTQVPADSLNDWIWTVADSFRLILRAARPWAPASNTEGATVQTQYSLSGDGSISAPLQLLNDVDIPGSHQFYGTNNLGDKGWYSNPALTLSSNTLLLSQGGGAVDLSGYLDNTDAQTLSFTSPNLSISSGNSVDLSALDTDDQTLSITGTSLSISEGNSVDLSHAATHITGGLDQIDGDQLDIDWNPSNYTPSTAPAEAGSADNLSAHLAGVDNKLEQIEADAYTSSTSGSINLGGEKFLARGIDMSGVSSKTVSLSNPVSGGSYVIYFTNADNTDTITWPANVYYEDGSTQPGGDALSSGRRIFTLLYTGTNFILSGGY